MWLKDGGYVVPVGTTCAGPRALDVGDRVTVRLTVGA